eukprot:Pgem_evm1s9667
MQTMLGGVKYEFFTLDNLVYLASFVCFCVYLFKQYGPKFDGGAQREKKVAEWIKKNSEMKTFIKLHNKDFGKYCKENRVKIRNLFETFME